MSTTGPVTRAMRPTAPAVDSATGAVAVSVIRSLFSGLLLGGDERVGAAHDLGDLLRDLGLAGVVREARVVA